MAGKQKFIKQDAKSLDSNSLIEANKRWNDFYGSRRPEIDAAVRAKRQIFEAWEAGVMTPEEYEVAKAICYREHKKIFDRLAEHRVPVINALQERQANAEKEVHNPLAARLIDDTLSDSLSPGHEKITKRHFTPGEGRSKSTNLSEDIEF
jgi:hypothetical protein